MLTALGKLQKQISEADAEVKRLTALQADAQKSEAEQRTKRSTELVELDQQLSVALERGRDLAKRRLGLAGLGGKGGRGKPDEEKAGDAEQAQASFVAASLAAPNDVVRAAIASHISPAAGISDDDLQLPLPKAVASSAH